MKKCYLTLILSTTLSLSGCVTEILNEHIDDVHRKGNVIRADKIIGFTRNEKSGQWMLAGEKSNYRFYSMDGRLATIMDNPELDKRYLNSATSPSVVFYKQNYCIILGYDTSSFSEEQLKQIQALAPDIKKGNNRSALGLSFFISGDDDKVVFINKKKNDWVERINIPFTLEFREEGTAYSKGLYPLSVAIDIVTAPLQLLALPFVIPNLHQ